MAAILFDLDGVFYEGDRPVGGGADVVAWARDNHIPHLFLTNTTSKDRSGLIEKLAAMHIDVQPERILTPPVAAVDWLNRHIEGPVALFVPPATESEFQQLSLHRDHKQPPAALVMGDLGEGWDYPTLNRAFRLLMADPQPYLIALGMTRYWKAPDGLRLDVAPFVTALQHASGVQPVVLGKPAADFYRTALAMLEVDAEDTVIVGDDIRSDIEGAQRCGIRGVLVRTGKFRPDDLESNIAPTGVLDSVTGLPQWWQNNTHHH